ncbi:ribonuclease H-like domain-containing protein [Tanacetum coccineum]
MVRTINNIIRTLLFQANLPPAFWVEALNMAVHLLNILPSSAIANEVPFTRLFSIQPDYILLRTFGCLCYPHLYPHHKLEPRATPAIFLGLASNHRGYRCFDLTTKTVTISRHVTFDESVFPYATTQPASVPTYTFLDNIPDLTPPILPVAPPTTTSHNSNNSTMAQTAPMNQPIPTATTNSPPTSPMAQSPTDPTPTFDSPDSHTNAPLIINNPPVNPNPTSVHPMVTHFCVGSNRPTERLSLLVSLVSPLPKSYRDAFNYLNWQHAMSDGSLSRYKARLVANGSTQLEGIDVDETFSPVVKPETVYMHQTPGFHDSQHPDYVCLLQHSLYGLKQAPRAWFQRFASYITRVGFHHSRCDTSLFIYRQGTNTAYLLLYVDDIVLTAYSERLLQQIIHSLHQEFSMTDLGSLNYFLGISVHRDSSRMFLSQRKYAGEILERAGMVNCNPSRTPVGTESKLGGDGDVVFDPTLYRSLAGSLQTLDYGLQLFSASTTDLVAFSDADWAGCPTTRRSTSGYCVFLGNNLLSWSSKRQPTLSRSSAEAEYRGVSNVVAETCWLRNLLRELHTPLSSATLVYCDNVSAVYLSFNPVQHQRTKHIEIDIHFVRDLVAAGHVRVLHVPSHYQYADIFIKGLPSALFEEFRSILSVWCPPAQTAGEC